MWTNDDGKEDGDKGSRIIAIDPAGKLSVIVDIGKVLPITGFDIAPVGFGKYGGQIFTLAQGKVGWDGGVATCPYTLRIYNSHEQTVTLP